MAYTTGQCGPIKYTGTCPNLGVPGRSAHHEQPAFYWLLDLLPVIHSSGAEVQSHFRFPVTAIVNSKFWYFKVYLSTESIINLVQLYQVLRSVSR